MRSSLSPNVAGMASDTPISFDELPRRIDGVRDARWVTIHDRSTSGSTRLVLLVLLLSGDAGRLSGREIAARTCVSAATVKRALAELEDLGLIKVDLDGQLTVTLDK